MKTLVRHGNSLALIIDKPFLDLLHIDENTPLEFLTDGDWLIVVPHRDTDVNERLTDVLKRINAQYGRAFKRLAE